MLTTTREREKLCKYQDGDNHSVKGNHWHEGELS